MNQIEFCKECGNAIRSTVKLPTGGKLRLPIDTPDALPLGVGTLKFCACEQSKPESANAA